MSEAKRFLELATGCARIAKASLAGGDDLHLLAVPLAAVCEWIAAQERAKGEADDATRALK